MIREVLNLERLLSMDPPAAAALLAIRRSDGGTAHDDQMLDAWLRVSDANVQAWNQTQAGWRAFDDAGDDELLTAMRRAAVKARPAGTFTPERMAAAAVILVILTGALLGLFLKSPPRPAPSALAVASAGPAPQVLVTAAGQRNTFKLADGSRVTMDGASRIEVTFSTARRDVRLRQGHAFFEVAHAAARPFAVSAGDRQVVAVGTAFDVRLDPRRLRVVLVEGRVSVGSPGSTAPPTLLNAGQQLEAEPGRPPVVSTADIDAVLDWRQGFVTFDDTPLSEVVRILNQSGPDKVVINDPRIARLRISGRFQTGDLERFGRTLAQVHPVRLVQTAPHRFEVVPAG